MLQNKEENKQQIWELYAELLDLYEVENFTAQEIASELSLDKKLVNKILHRLIDFKAVECVGIDMWKAKIYRLNEEFIS